MLGMMRSQLYRTRIPRYIHQRFRIPHKTGDFMPFIGNDVGILESQNDQHHVVICVFTAHHYGVGTYLEHAIGRIAQRVAEYFLDRAP
jgi:hypothetical protein